MLQKAYLLSAYRVNAATRRLCHSEQKFIVKPLSHADGHLLQGTGQLLSGNGSRSATEKRPTPKLNYGRIALQPKSNIASVLARLRH
jgi:hypothetical protein